MSLSKSQRLFCCFCMAKIINIHFENWKDMIWSFLLFKSEGKEQLCFPETKTPFSRLHFITDTNLKHSITFLAITPLCFEAVYEHFSLVKGPTMSILMFYFPKPLMYPVIHVAVVTLPIRRMQPIILQSWPWIMTLWKLDKMLLHTHIVSALLSGCLSHWWLTLVIVRNVSRYAENN